jgi:hypothetical protein
MRTSCLTPVRAMTAPLRSLYREVTAPVLYNVSNRDTLTLIQVVRFCLRPRHCVGFHVGSSARGHPAYDTAAAEVDGKEPCAVQVLDALADPTSPTQLLAAKLRFAAAAVARTQRKEFAEWLDDGLFKILLGVMRRLPDMGLGDLEAAEVCAAAAAGIGNTILASRPANVQLQTSAIPSADMLREDAGCVEVLRSLVRYGLVNPAATQPLPPGSEIAMRCTYSGVPAAVHQQHSCTTPTSRQFWTPWRICAVTICDRILVGGKILTPAMAEALAPAVTSTTFQHLLTSAIEHPCGTVHGCTLRSYHVRPPHPAGYTPQLMNMV